MKKQRVFLIGPCLAMLALSGCSALNAGDANDYYRVELYSDYQGIDDDIAAGNIDVSKAVAAGALHLGYCYAKKNKAANLDGYVVENSHRYSESVRKAPSGQKYTFREWTGFYSANQKVDVEEITAGCSLFATFDLIDRLFLVTIDNNYETVGNDFLRNGDLIGDSDNLRLDADLTNHDPLNHGYNPYYMNYAFNGYKVTTKDDDGKVISIDHIDSYEDVNDYVVGSTVEIEVDYLESKYSYDVAIEPIYRDGTVDTPLDKSLFNPNELSQNVVYGSAMNPMATSKLSGDRVFSHYEGTYGAADPVPVSIRGLSFQPAHVEYNATVKAVYVDEEKSTKATFHLGEQSGVLKTETRTYAYGSTPLLPDSKIIIPSGWAFTGFYTTTAGSLEPFDFDHLYDYSAIDLYPVLVPSRLTYTSQTSYVEAAKNYDKKFFYLFDSELGGYTLENFALYDGSELGTVKGYLPLSASDFWNKENVAGFATSVGSVTSDLLSRYGFVAVASFKNSSMSDAKGDSAARISNITLPNSVTRIMDNGFAGLSALGRLSTGVFDLSSSKITSIGSHAFRNNINITSIKLPNFENLSVRLFDDCESIEATVPYTKAKVDEMIAEGKVSDHWNYNRDTEIVVHYAA